MKCPPLACTQEQFEGLHAALDHTRRSTQTIKVSREALSNLLMDHSELLAIVDRKAVART